MNTTPLLRLAAAILDTDTGTVHDNWRLRAACRHLADRIGHEATDKIFFPPRARASQGMTRYQSERVRRLRIADAKTICDTCPVTTQCLTYGNRMNDYHAIWGGKTPRERGRKRDDT